MKIEGRRGERRGKERRGGRENRKEERRGEDKTGEERREERRASYILSRHKAMQCCVMKYTEINTHTPLPLSLSKLSLKTSALHNLLST